MIGGLKFVRYRWVCFTGFLISILVLLGFIFLEYYPYLQTSKQPSVPETLQKQARAENPEQFPYLNDAKADRYRKILERMEPNSSSNSPSKEFLKLSLKEIRERINAGTYTRALSRIQELRDRSTDPGSRLTDRLHWLEAQGLFLRAYKAVCDPPQPAACSYPLQSWPEAMREDLTISRRLFSKLRQKGFRPKSSRWFLTLIDQTLKERATDESWTHASGDRPTLITDRTKQTPLKSRGRAGSVIVEDFNRDRRLDILTSSMGIKDGDLRLYWGKTGSTFREVTGPTGLKNRTGGLNVVHGDYNNDGYPDLYVLRGSGLRRVTVPNSLLKNVQGKQFTDVTNQAGLRRNVNSVTASWVDYNRDGYLDLFVGAEKEQPGRTNALLFRNDGAGSFTPVSESVGLEVPQEIKGATWGDVNNDGRPDLYLSLHDNRNRLYVNRGKRFLQSYRFEERGENMDVDQPVHSFATWFWDYNNDGREDLFVYGGSSKTRWVSKLETGIRHETPRQAGRPVVYENRGNRFVNVTDQLNLPSVPNVMGANYGDVNNDGRLDLLLGTGSPPPTGLAYNRLFINRGQTFEDISKKSVFSYLTRGHGIGVGDLDGDGQSEIVQSQGGVFAGNRRQNSYFDVPESSHNWFHLRLIGIQSNRDAVGARVALKLEGPSGATRILHRTVRAGGSFGGSSYRLEFGLGRATEIQKLKVSWPRIPRSTEVFRDLEINTFYTLTEGESQPVQARP